MLASRLARFPRASFLACGLFLFAATAGAQSISLLDARATEGQEGASEMLFEARLSAPAAQPVRFDFATSDGTAIAGVDYNAQSLVNVLVIPAGQTYIRFPVLLRTDTVPDPSRYFNASISNVVGATVADGNAVGLILDDDGTVQVSAAYDPMQQGSTGTGLYGVTQGNGRFVAFVASGNDLVAGQPVNSYNDVFLRDMRTGLTRLVSVAANGGAANGISDYPAVSDDGRFVAFMSEASNLVAQDGNGVVGDVFVRDMQTGVTTLVSVPSSGAAGANGSSTRPNFSADGRYLVFASSASNLVSSDSNGATSDVFLRDLQAGTTSLLSRATDGVSSANGASTGARISANGRYVAFNSLASNLASGDNNGVGDVYLIDTQSGSISRVSVASDGGDPDRPSGGPSISGDGRFVTFGSTATNLGAPFMSGALQVYVRDRQTGTTQLVSYALDNSGAMAKTAGGGSISRDGRYVAFDSDTPGGPTDTNNTGDVFVRDREDGTYVYKSVKPDGTFDGWSASMTASLSGDGRYVVYYASPEGIAAGDFNGRADIVRGAVLEDQDLPTLFVGDWWATENDAGIKQYSITVTRSSLADVTFDLETGDGIAEAGKDYNALSLHNLTFPAGQTWMEVQLEIIGDTVDEPDESLHVYLENQRGARLRDPDNLVIIGDNDVAGTLPPLSISDASIAEGNSGSTTMNFTVSIPGPAVSDIHFDAITANGTAVAEGDYQSVQVAGGVIPAGASSATIPVVVNGDTVVEPDETFTVTLSNVTGATLADASATGTILNDDVASQPTLSIGDVSIAEGNSGSKTATFTISLSAPAASDVGFSVSTQDSSATAGSDYTALNLVGQTIPAGQSSKTVSVTIKGDTVFEPDETFLVVVGSVTGAAVVDGVAVGTITNDDASGGGGASFSINDVTVTEGNSLTKTATFTITLSAPQSSPTFVDLATADGSATAGSDYVAKTQAGLRFAPGVISKTFAVTINGDTTSEPDETFTVNLSNPVGATIADGQGAGTITNDDAGSTPALSIGDVSISEGNSGTKTATFTVTLSAAASSTVSFNVATANDTATAGSDYVALSLAGQSIGAGQTSKTVSVTINGDTAVEADETFNVNVSNVVGATVADGSALGTITNDDSAGGPTFSIGDVTVAEGNSLTKTATFTITLSAAQSGPTFVDLATADGTAMAGSDYVAKTQAGLRFAAGATSKTFAVTINGDTTSEPDETFTVNLSNPVGATIADGQGVGTISNDDAGATPTLSIADASVGEGNSGTKTLTFTVSLSQAAASAVTYDIATSNGTATAGSDYVASSLAGQSIAAGTTSKTFSVTINGDATVEPDETFTVNVSNVLNATIADGSATGTITNDDSAGGGPSFSIGDVTVTEGNSLTKQATFTITLSAAQSGPTFVDVATANGSATAGSDYVAKTQAALRFPIGATSKTFTVTINGDTTVESDETFTVNLSNPVGATIADGVGQGTITNDDAATLTLARFDARGLVDDVDDRNGEPQVAPREYATLLLDAATQLCRRAPNATIVAVEGVEHRQALAELADTVSTSCANAPRYAAVMADGDRRGFLVELPATNAVAAAEIMGAPALDANAKSTMLLVQGAGHERPLAIVLASAPQGSRRERDAQSRALEEQLRLFARQRPDVSLVLLGAGRAIGMVDLTARDALPDRKIFTLPADRVLVNQVLLRTEPGARIDLATSPELETPAQVMRLP